MKNHPRKTHFQRFLLYPVLRGYKAMLERKIDRDKEQGTFDKDTSQQLDCINYLME